MRPEGRRLRAGDVGADHAGGRLRIQRARLHAVLLADGDVAHDLAAHGQHESCAVTQRGVERVLDQQASRGGAAARGARGDRPIGDGASPCRMSNPPEHRLKIAPCVTGRDRDDWRSRRRGQDHTCPHPPEQANSTKSAQDVFHKQGIGLKGPFGAVDFRYVAGRARYAVRQGCGRRPRGRRRLSNLIRPTRRRLLVPAPAAPCGCGGVEQSVQGRSARSGPDQRGEHGDPSEGA